ncbi:hypothetical protein VTK26DRAFT_9178 [Humicola hyalothermophila]
MPATREYGDLIVTLTSSYDFRWNDQGSGADRDGGFWHPKPQGDLRALGSVAINNYNDLNNNWAVLLVGDNPSSRQPGKGPAVQAPVNFQGIWSDQGSGSNRDGSFWRPIPPQGYLSLGDVCWPGYGKPSTDQVWCVRADLVADGVFAGGAIWDDRGSGANGDASFWEITPGPRDSASEYLPALAGTFRCNWGYSAPDQSLAKVPVLYVPKGGFPPSPHPPRLTASTLPEVGETFSDTAHSSVTLPFTSLFAPSDRASLDALAGGGASPFCTVSKSVRWIVLRKFPNYQNITISEVHKERTGMQTTTSTTTSHSMGISISAETGYGLSKWSVSLNYQFSLSKTNSLQEIKENIVEKTLTVEPNTVAIVWGKQVTIHGVRSDGPRMGGELSFNANEEIAVTTVAL